jgi:peptidyl-prolyl cis-trans isomerase B (cyclophilin B)
MRRLLLPLLIACLALVATGCGGDDSSTSTAASTAADTVAQADAGAAGCQSVAAPEPKQVDQRKPTKGLAADSKAVVKLQTSCGEIDIALDAKRQPRTAASFAGLASDGVYDGLTFHRIVPDFVIQGGDPAGDGTGGPGYTITEKPPGDAQYTRGVVAMAKTEIERPGTSGSQFFIVTAEDAQLPADYAVVGTVVGDASLATVDKIAAVPTDAQDAPTSPVVIEKATVSGEN